MVQSDTFAVAVVKETAFFGVKNAQVAVGFCVNIIGKLRFFLCHPLFVGGDAQERENCGGLGFGDDKHLLVPQSVGICDIGGNNGLSFLFVIGGNKHYLAAVFFLEVNQVCSDFFHRFRKAEADSRRAHQQALFLPQETCLQVAVGGLVIENAQKLCVQLFGGIPFVLYGVDEI